MNVDLLSDEAQAQLERWSKRSQALFAELLEDAGSDLQRELLQRAVAAGHTPKEVHAFADELRGLADEDVFGACTLDERAPQDYTVAQLLRAEADPLYAFELNGHPLDPGEEDEPPPAPTPPAPEERTRTVALDPVSAGVARKKKPAAFDAESSDGRGRKLDWQDLGRSPAPPAPPRPASGSAPAVAPAGAKYVEDLANEATRALGVTWREHELDLPGSLTLEDALARVAGPVGRGIPVPCAVGPAPGASRRFVLLLQLNTSGKSRAWQLYDPFSSELVWANEGDLLARTELPFANKLNRRLTRIALPSSRGASV